MRTPDRLPDEALDGLLDGSPSAEAVGTPLATYLAAVRHDAVSTEPTPSAALAAVLAEGFDPAALPAVASASARGDEGILTRGILTLRRRAGLLAGAAVTKFAALGLLSKAAAAGAAFTVAASGAGAAGILPAPAQTTFDEVVGREAPADEADAGVDTSPDIEPAPMVGTEVAEDATESSDGEPGVDGGEVAEDASDGRAVPDEPRRDVPARDRTDGTPAEDEVDDGPSGDRPGADAPARDQPAGEAPGARPPAEAPAGDTGQRDTRRQDAAEPEAAEQQTAEQQPAEQRTSEQSDVEAAPDATPSARTGSDAGAARS